MTTILLIRHAEYERLGSALKGRTPGVHLNEQGRAQAARLGERLSRWPVRAVFSSPLERARETAEALAQRLGLSIEISPGLQEIDYGDWTGREVRDLTEEPLWKLIHAQRARFRPPGGERMVEVQARMLEALEGFQSRYPDATVAAVSHGDPIRVILCHYLGVPLDFMDRLAIDPASLSVVEFHDSGPRVLRINDTPDPF